MIKRKCLKCGRFLKFVNREIFNNLKDYSEGVHFEGWYICKCGFKIKQEDYIKKLKGGLKK